MLSVVVPAFNSSRTIEACLTALTQSNFKDFELIVVDDGSSDATAELARKFTKITLVHPKNIGPAHARVSGTLKAKGDPIVFIDSDILVHRDSLQKIADYFQTHESIDAITGLLSKETPRGGFLSIYKNLYMNYTFSKLPDQVDFLYGSIYAIRREALKVLPPPSPGGSHIAEDTELGQILTREGKQVRFMRQLEVVHLKEYTLHSFLKASFLIPYRWALLFKQSKGWQGLGSRLIKRKPGFAHASSGQVISLALAPLMFLFLFILAALPQMLIPLVVLTLVWFLVNRVFLISLLRDKGIYTFILGTGVTLLDHLFKAVGAFVGLLDCRKSS